MSQSLTLHGRLFIYADIKVCTGLHIGGSGGDFSIGAVDKSVISDPLTGRPYIPGSSIRGKMRSLTEKYRGEVTGQQINQGEIHSCITKDKKEDEKEKYSKCPICNIYGVAASDFSLPTRLIVRDVHLHRESAEQLQRAKTELPYTEVKTEVSIDRVTSQANPRSIERVPAGAVFGPLEMIFSVYDTRDIAFLDTLMDGLTLLEDDYLGGHGSRGSGKVAFINLEAGYKSAQQYSSYVRFQTYATLADLTGDLPALKDRLRDELFGNRK